MQNSEKSEKLYWRFDVSTFKLLGRELITDRITAVYELVKNCYDANATKVTLEFTEVKVRSNKSEIVIRDNGLGMSLIDIRDKWLVVGTASKRRKTHSPAPFNRRYIGEKGVGRFAVDKLGGHLHIKTKQKGDSQTLNIIINWGDYEKEMLTGQMSLFTDMGNEFYYDYSIEEEQGTELTISNLHEAWNEDRVHRLDKQLARILSPTYDVIPPFNIYIKSFEFSYLNKLILPDPLEDLATIDVFIPFRKKWEPIKPLRFSLSVPILYIPFKEKKRIQGSLKFDLESGTFKNEWLHEESFGLVSMRLYYFDGSAQTNFKNKYKGTENYIEGVKIYRDGVICTPFAEYESDRNKRRDILGIDKRRYTEAFNKLSISEVIGIVDISKERNPNIIDSTSRQDFVDNDEYRALKDFIIKQLDILADYKSYKRTVKTAVVQNNLKRATADVKEIAEEIKKITRANPEMKASLAEVLTMANRVVQVVETGVKEQQEAEKEFQRKEDIFLSLMSLQDYATNLAHAIRLILGKIKRAAEYFKNRFPDPKLEHRFKQYAILIYDEMERMSKAIDFMLSYAESDLEDTEFTINSLLDELFDGPYIVTFDLEQIKVFREISKDVRNLIIKANKKFLEDVLSNLIANSIKAMANRPNKQIKCESYIENNTLCLIISDNGIGIKNGDEHKVFDIYYTTTAEQGGAGLGLFVAKTRMKALNGNIEVISSIFAPDGASFKITLPLKKLVK